MKVREWCSQHCITKANYYWGLRKVREAFLEVTDIYPAFVELPTSIQAETATSTISKTVAILKCKNQLTLESTAQASLHLYL